MSNLPLGVFARCDIEPLSPAVHAQTIPEYLSNTYTWAYLDPDWMRWLDNHVVVQAILWGNADRLMNGAIAEFGPGQRVLQPASVYGDFAGRLAARVGLDGHLDLCDVAPVQVDLCRRKFGKLANVTVARANAAVRSTKTYDGVCCFFLLHEVPEDYKRRIVNSLLSALEPGGKVVFVDYHRMRRFHPLRPVMWVVFRFLEPFAQELLGHEIRDYAEVGEDFEWTKETFFGGLYQKVVARRSGPRHGAA